MKTATARTVRPSTTINSKHSDLLCKSFNLTEGTLDLLILHSLDHFLLLLDDESFDNFTRIHIFIKLQKNNKPQAGAALALTHDHYP
jgi:hypothetical protein